MDRAEIQKRLAYKKQQRDIALASLNGLLKNAEVESYGYSDADGNQNVRRRKISELQEFISAIEKEIDNLERSLRHVGIMTFSTNRYA